MKLPQVILSSFTPIRIGEMSPQNDVTDKLIKLFSLSICGQEQPQSQEEADKIFTNVKDYFDKYGVKESHIKQRSFHTVKDANIEQGILPKVHPQPEYHPNGVMLDERMKMYKNLAFNTVRNQYASCQNPPDDIIHVSCSGYMSPSPVQSLVSEKNWKDTTVTHSYHMGCYGAFPAVRMAHGFMVSSFALQNPKSKIDIFHTEYLSLHLDSNELSPGNVIDMTLFGDGFIQYSAYSEESFKEVQENGLKILSIKEQVIPDSGEAMSWDLGPNKFKMYLSKHVPLFISDSIKPFVIDLARMAGFDFNKDKDELLFAVHPGGPKILEFIQDRLELRDDQIELSWKILKENGNMSSVTVPYIWNEIINDPNIKVGQKVLSLAFGPGLTACGFLMEKV